MYIYMIYRYKSQHISYKYNNKDVYINRDVYYINIHDWCPHVLAVQMHSPGECTEAPTRIPPSSSRLSIHSFIRI